MAEIVDHIRSDDLYDIPSDQFADYRKMRIDAVREGKTGAGEIRLKDGRIIQYGLRSLPDGGRMLNYFDITQLKRSEEAAKRPER